MLQAFYTEQKDRFILVCTTYEQPLSILHDKTAISEQQI